jgi:hypothetical protein
MKANQVNINKRETMIESKVQAKEDKCQINQLTDLYVKWCEKNNINNPTSADEVILRDDINNEQRKWLESFIENWNIAEDLDRYIHTEEKI